MLSRSSTIGLDEVQAKTGQMISRPINIVLWGERERDYCNALAWLHLHIHRQSFFPPCFFFLCAFSSDSNAAHPEDYAMCEMVANTLPEANLHTFTHIIAFLRLLLESMTDSRTTGNVLGGTLIQQ